MQKPHYAEVPAGEPEQARRGPLHNFDIKQTIVPRDLEAEHNRRHRLDYLTLRIKFFVPIVFLLAMLPLTIIMLLLCVARPIGDIDPAIGVLETISYISESNPVVDIWPITGSQICENTGDQPGSLGTWRATVQGCSCSSIPIILRRACNADELAQCENVAAQPAIETFTWNGDRFCMTRLSDFKRTAGACPSGYQKCGNLICVLSTDSCPISDVQILAQTATTPVGYTERLLTFEQKLVYSNTGSDLQFAQFSYETQYPCLNYNAFYARDNGEVHVLEVENRTAGCMSYGQDAESTALNTRSETDFNDFNYINLRTVNVPGYSTVITGSDISLTARYRFVTIQTDLCAQYYVSDVPQLVTDVEDFAYLYRGITISGVILSFITFCIALVYIRVLQKHGVWMINKEEPFGRRFIFQIILLHCAYAVITTIMGNMALSKVSDQESYLKSIEEADCFATQPILNDAMDEVTTYLTNRIDGLVFLNNIIAFIAGGTTIVVIVNLLFRKLRNYEGGEKFSGIA